MRQLALLALIFAFVGVTTLPAQAEPGLGETALPLVAVDLNGSQVSLAEMNAAGKFVMLDFWASWCGPCMGELPHVAPFYDEFASPRFELIGISLDSDATEGKMREAIAGLGLHYPIVYEGGGWQARLAVEWDVHSIPATFLVNPEGVIVLKNIRGEEGLALVNKIVNEIPDFLPPPVVLTVEATGKMVVARADIAEITVDPHRFTFSIACFAPGGEEEEEGRWTGGDYTLDIVPQPEGWELTLTPSPDNDAELPVTVAMEEEYLVFTLASDKPLATGYFELAMFVPLLEADIAFGSQYVKPPPPEAEAESSG